ncbi:MAG: HD domain-containing phosphohydrolase [Acidimicrobiales bacterium]
MTQDQETAGRGPSRIRARLYAYGVLASALALLALVAVTPAHPVVHLPWLPLALFVAVVVASENLAVLLPTLTGVSPTTMAVMAALVVYAQSARPSSVVLAAALTGVVAGLVWSDARRRKWHLMAFNSGQMSLGAAAAAAVYLAIPRGSGLAVLLPVTCAAASFTTINVVLVVVGTPLEHSVTFSEVWRQMRPQVPGVVVFGVLGALIGQLYASVGPVAVVLLIGPLYIARATVLSSIRLKETKDQAIAVFLRAIRAKDAYTAAHTERVAQYTGYIGEGLGFAGKRQEVLRQAALMHDIGKLAVPKHLLNKPGRLTDEEFVQVQRHAHVCIDIMNQVDFMKPMISAAAGHHARYDGGGYGGTGEYGTDALAVAVADAYDAMTSTRSYRRALTQEVAVAELRQKSGTQFDPACVEALVAGLERRHERHGAGYESQQEVEAFFEVPPPVAGTGSAGLGDLEPGTASQATAVAGEASGTTMPDEPAAGP